MSGKDRQSLKITLRDYAHSLGFQLFGIAAAKPLLEDLERLRNWVKRGYHASMRFMTETMEYRANPERLLRNAKSVIVCAVSYAQPAFDFSIQTGKPEGFLARFALGGDYHLLIRQRLNRLAAALRDKVGAATQTQCHVDSSPLLERAFAREAGLGFIGKNNCLIHPLYGSWILLGCILTDCEIPADQPMPEQCGGCSRCIDACPTHALAGPYQLDARKCLSYWTIERREFLNWCMASQFQGRLFGCDTCQESCPYNEPVPTASDPDFLPGSGRGCANPSICSLAAILAIRSNREFERAFAGSPLLRTRKRGLQRNAIIAAIHYGRSDLAPIIQRMADDPTQSIDIRKTARWALDRLKP